MSERVVITRQMEMRRGGTKNNVAAPIWTIEAQNKSGGALARGDVVVWDKTSNSTADVIAFTTTASGNSLDVLGMVYDTSIANGAFGKIQVFGPTDALKVNGTTDIAIGDYISTYTSAGIGQKTTGAGCFARALEAYSTDDSSGVIDAFIQVAFAILPAASVSNLADGVDLAFGDSSDITIQWDGTDLEIAGAAANSLINFGGANQLDVKLMGNTTDDFAYWDGSANTLGLTDGEKVGFGNTAAVPDVSINFDGTDLLVAAAAANTQIVIGDANQMDVKLIGNTTDDFALWDGSASTLGFTDGEKVGFGNTAATPDVSITWDATDLEIAAQADDTAINFGTGTNSFDVKIFGNTSDLFALWDASASVFQLQDATKLGFGNVSTAPDVTVTWDGTDLEIAAAADDSAINFGTGTNSFDVKLFGNDTDHYVIWDASGDDLNLMDGTSIKFGTGADIEIRWDSTDLDVLAVGDDLVIKWGNGTNSIDQWWYGNASTDYVLWDPSLNNLDLLGAADLRIANIGTLDFAAQAAGNATFTVTGLASTDLVIISPREATQGVLAVDKVELNKLTIRNSASESANVEVNYYVLAKAS